MPKSDRFEHFPHRVRVANHVAAFDTAKNDLGRGGYRALQFPSGYFHETFAEEVQWFYENGMFHFKDLDYAIGFKLKFG